jgi:type III secretion system FlhB-like substrate exporter
MEIAKIILEYIRVIIWPIVVFLGVIIFREPIYTLLKRINKLGLPGGASLDFGEKIKETENLSQEVRNAPKDDKRKESAVIPLTEANARMISLGLVPSPSGLDMVKYFDLAKEDPNIALAGLRMELEILIKNIAKGFDIVIEPKKPLIALLRKLKERSAITSDQYELILNIISLCNDAIHGTRVSREEAETVIDASNILAEDYLAWLSWGFPDNWKPQKNE